MVTYVNVTGHPITLQHPEGEPFTVEPCGVIISAEMVEWPYGVPGDYPDGVEVVTSKPISTREMDKELTKLEQLYEDGVIIGSYVAAQAYPGRVLSMIPVVGFERVPPAQKRNRADKFNAF